MHPSRRGRAAAGSAVEPGPRSEGPGVEANELTTIHVPPGTTPADQCTVKASCPSSSPNETSGYDAPFLISLNRGKMTCDEDDDDFSDAMAGCGPETLFGILGESTSAGVAFCPVPVDYPGTQVIPCDSCTGAPPPGWVVVTWSLQDPCMSPSGACNLGTCGDPI